MLENIIAVITALHELQYNLSMFPQVIAFIYIPQNSWHIKKQKYIKFLLLNVNNIDIKSFHVLYNMIDSELILHGLVVYKINLGKNSQQVQCRLLSDK